MERSAVYGSGPFWCLSRVLCRCRVRRRPWASNPGSLGAYDTWLVEDALSRGHGIMVQVSIEEIQRDLGAYLQRVEAGEMVVIVRAGPLVAEMKPVALGAKPLRPFGLCAGEFTVPEDFDVPLPEDILKAFEGA
jgi:antitoxin (DNA-binding transcriptional repressor) of toxin-antitoxin stability system